MNGWNHELPKGNEIRCSGSNYLTFFNVHATFRCYNCIFSKGVTPMWNGYPYACIAMQNNPSPGPRDITISKFSNKWQQKSVHFSKNNYNLWDIWHQEQYCVRVSMLPMVDDTGPNSDCSDIKGSYSHTCQVSTSFSNTQWIRVESISCCGGGHFYNNILLVTLHLWCSRTRNNINIFSCRITPTPKAEKPRK